MNDFTHPTGFYTYDALENWSAPTSTAQTGSSPDGKTSRWKTKSTSTPKVGLDVTVVEQGRALVLRGGVSMGAVPPPYDCTWAFVLREQPDGTTRLLARERYA